MITDKKRHIYTKNWIRNIILGMIINDFDKFVVKQLPVKKDKKKHTNTFTYIFSIEKESYEFIK